jgi:ligand-binding sensor domain-containing protein/serine phosphatase RsbU (regulator of sigma subunit)
MKCFRNIFILFVCCSKLSYSQIFNFKNYNTEQGLPQAQVLSIFQDNKGYMWFGTNSGGVAKYDGNVFKTFTSQDGLNDNTINVISSYNNDQLLFGTAQGLSVYNGVSFKKIDNKKIGGVYQICNDGNQTWIGSYKGAWLLKNNELQRLEDSVLNKSLIRAIYIDKQNNIWFGSAENGLIIYNQKSKSFKYINQKNGLMSNYVFSIAKKDEDTLLIGTRTGLNKITKDFIIIEAKELPGNSNIAYSSIINNNNNEFFFGTYSEGVINFDFNKNKRTKKYDYSNGLVNNPIISLYKDREGNLWIGTDGSGVFKFLNERMSYYTKANGLQEELINAVVQDNNENLWIACRSNGVTKINKTEIKNYKFALNVANSLPDNDVNAILPLENGSVLFGTKDGLCIFENNIMKIFSNELIRHKYILSLYKDSKNTIWISTAEGTFTLKDNVFSSNDLINAEKTSAEFLNLFTVADKNHNVWVGTEKGILKLNNNKITKYNQANGFADKQTNCGAVDDRGGLWLGTDNDLYLYSDGIFKVILKGNHQSFGYINFLKINKNNKLFIGSNNGLDIIDINDNYSLKLNIKHLGKDDGLLSLESNYGASAFDNKGRLMVGTVKGLEIYDPELDKPNLNEALTSITQVKLFYGQENIHKYSKQNDSSNLLPKQLTLPYNKNNLTLNFVGISLIAPEKVMYQYKLEGLDLDWTPITNKTEATYPSLPPGKYKFLVKASNNDGVWNKEPVFYEFEILAPWYNTWWFYTICVVVVIAAVIIYNFVKTKKLIADRRRLEQVVNIRTKELRDEKEKVEVINKEVTQQKHIIEEKQQEIISSINYAQRIQNAVLTGSDVWSKISKDYFIVFKPRDIVSGDFYWAHLLPNGRAVFTVADCTGHGVPGGFMSMLGNSFLNEIVVENKIFKADEILNRLRDKVINALEQKGHQQQKDGMDMALCVWNKMDNTLEFAGANNGIYLLRNNELLEYKGNKMPIGLYLDETPPFKSQTIKLEKNDLIYMSSDGFPDQFGGPKGKKFKYKQLEEILVEINDLQMKEQSKILSDRIEAWKSGFEQTDDICLLGIKIS